MPGKHECWCGRSPSGICVGLHKFSEEAYQEYLKEKDKPKDEGKHLDNMNVPGREYDADDEAEAKELAKEETVEVYQPYTKESAEKIIKNFQNLLMEADNFPRDKNPNDYREFWTGLRGEGASLLGLTNYLKELVEKQLENSVGGGPNDK
jgi:hypothetical protein